VVSRIASVTHSNPGSSQRQRAVLKLAVDENFDNRILRGLLRHLPNLDILRIQDTEIFGADDPVVLEWCSFEGRVLLSQDYKTIPKYAYERVVAGRTFAGLIMVPKNLAFAQCIEEIRILLETLEPAEWLNHIEYLPIVRGS
jgi:Domain of unknown function (DUF5615)